MSTQDPKLSSSSSGLNSQIHVYNTLSSTTAWNEEHNAGVTFGGSGSFKAKTTIKKHSVASDPSESYKFL